MLHRFHDYRIAAVYGTVDDATCGELARFWLAERAVPSEERARSRCGDVVLISRNPDGEIVGVSSVYRERFRGAGDVYWFYRMFIRAADRVPGMMRFMTALTRDHLRDLEAQDKPRGVIIVTENPKLMRRGTRRTLERIGFTYVGATAKGQDIWRSDF